MEPRSAVLSRRRGSWPTRIASSLSGLILLAFGATGCAGFHSAWKRNPTTPIPGGVAGRWEGTWLSSVNGHTGRLECVVEPRTEDQYRAWFHGTWWRVFTTAYSLDLTVQPSNGGWVMHAERNLWPLGPYRFEGTVSGDQFEARYNAKSDHGTFSLRRAPTPD